jgi:hypothetical protein
MALMANVENFKIHLKVFKKQIAIRIDLLERLKKPDESLKEEMFQHKKEAYLYDAKRVQDEVKFLEANYQKLWTDLTDTLKTLDKHPELLIDDHPSASWIHAQVSMNSALLEETLEGYRPSSDR